MKPIPIDVAKHIAKIYGYDQVIIIARKVDRPAGVGETAKQAIQGGEHCTTYGIDKTNCDVAARIGEHLKFDVMKWTKENVHEDRAEQRGRPNWRRVYDGETRNFDCMQQLCSVSQHTLQLAKSAIAKSQEQDYYNNYGEAYREIKAALGIEDAEG